MRADRNPQAVHNPRYKHLLGKLREARALAGLTQVEVARALGRTQAWVSKCELGERRIDPIDLQDFARVYRKPFGFLAAPNGARKAGLFAPPVADRRRTRTKVQLRPRHEAGYQELVHPVHQRVRVFGWEIGMPAG